jgi:uncharacterized membrane protein YfcA
MSFWVWVVDPQLAKAMSVFGALTGQIITAVRFRRNFEWKLLLPFVAGGFLGIPIGIWILPHLNIVIFKAVFGLILITWCPLMLIGNKLPPITKAGKLADVAIGAIGGIMGGIGGFNGTVPTLWCAMRGFNKNTQRTIIQNFNLAILTVTMITYVGSAIIVKEMIPTFVIIALSMMIPTLIGALLYVGINEAAFRKIILSLLTISGITLLSSSLWQLIS